MDQIQIRVSSAEKAKLRDAAHAKGSTLSAFLRYAAMTEAARILAQRAEQREVKP